MPIPGGVLVAGGAARCLYSATGMLRFLARLSGRRRHVRRSFGGTPGAATIGAASLLSVESLSSSPSAPPPPPPPPPLPPPSPVSSSPSSSYCFTTSSTTTSISTSSASNKAISKDLLADQSIADPIWINENNLDLDDIRLRQCYLRCRRNIHSGLRQQESMNKSSTCTGDGLVNSTATTTTATTTSTSIITKAIEEIEDDSLSRIADLRGEYTTTTTTTTTFTTTTTMTSRRQQQHRNMDDIDDNDNRVSSNTNNNSSSSSINSRLPLTWMTYRNNSGSTGVARYRRRRKIPSYFVTLLILSYTLFGIAEACSSRSTPKPRPPTPTPRPNITFHMYTCPPDYAEWYCLNGATCFTVKIQESLLYNCLCANGFIGQRCEFKDLDGSYLPSRQRVMLETASIAGGVTIAVFLVVIICIAAYIHCKRKQKELRTSSTCVDTVDGPVRDPERRPFSNCNRPIMTFMSKNSNCTPGMCLSIEQTRMPGWNDYSQVELTRLASINEAKHSSQ